MDKLFKDLLMVVSYVLWTILVLSCEETMKYTPTLVVGGMVSLVLFGAAWHYEEKAERHAKMRQPYEKENDRYIVFRLLAWVVSITFIAIITFKTIF
jgi:heme/copper-type cytochrome/quinol oxidase subunit 2